MAMGRRTLTRMMGAAAAAFSLGSTVRAQNDASPKRSLLAFRDAVAAGLKRRLPNAVFTYPADDLIDVGGGDKVAVKRVYVGNLYKHYINGDMSFDEAAAKLLDAIPAAEPLADREHLVVLVRPTAYLRASFPSGYDGLVRRPLAADLEYVIALDGEKTLSILEAKPLKAVEPDVEKLWSLAVANTERRVGRLKIEPFDEQVWTLTSPNDLGLSVMILDGFWATPPVTLAGPSAVAAIQKNLLVIVDTAATSSFARVREWMIQLKDDPYTMSRALPLRSGGGWKEI